MGPAGPKGDTGATGPAGSTMAFDASNSVVVTSAATTFVQANFGAYGASASCPFGMYAISGGGDTTDLNPGDSTLMDSEPTGGSTTSPATGWMVDYSVNAFYSGGSITAYVVCGAVNSVVVTSAATTFVQANSGAYGASASCPFGMYAVGGGGDTTDINPGDSTLMDSEPTGGSTTSAATGWMVDYSVNAFYSGGSITAYVVCGS